MRTPELRTTNVRNGLRSLAVTLVAGFYNRLGRRERIMVAANVRRGNGLEPCSAR